MTQMAEQSLQEVEFLKKRIQHLEEEVAKVKMKMSGKKWL
jgi:hypothetical protein